MKESIGNAFVTGFVVTFLFLFIFILSAAINYSRANKVKNRILNYIATEAEDGVLGSTELEKIVREQLSNIGYKTNNGGWKQNNCTQKCKNMDNCSEAINGDSEYHYCVYSFYTERGYYYGVTTFMYFDIPIIGAVLEFPVYGETRVIYDLGNK